MSTQPGLKKNMKTALALAVSGVIASVAQQAYAASANDATVVYGDATVQQQSINHTQINQGSDKAIINWSDFNIEVDQSVQFDQPGAHAVILNRVTGTNGSEILGDLSANGQVFLVNQNGIVFGADATVDVAGLVASSLDIADQDFINGNYNFSADGAQGSVINLGNIQAAEGGYVALLGNQVSNEGVIAARLGSVAAVAGDSLILNFDSEGLITVEITEATLNALVENKGLIQADGGVVYMKASTASALLSTVVNNEGVVQAASAEERDGKIILRGWGEEATASNTGTLDTNNADGSAAGFVELSGAHFVKGGEINTAELLIDPDNVTIVQGSGPVIADTVYEDDLTNSATTIEADQSILVGDMGDDELNLGTGSLTLRLTGVKADGTISFADSDDTIVTNGGTIVLNAQDGNGGSFGTLGGFEASGFTGRVDLLSDSGDIGSDALDGAVFIDALALNIDITGDAYLDLLPSALFRTYANISADELVADVNGRGLSVQNGDINSLDISNVSSLVVNDTGADISGYGLTIESIDAATGITQIITNTGDLHIAGDIVVLDPATHIVDLTSAGNITQAAGTLLDIDKLVAVAGGSITLTSTGNDLQIADLTAGTSATDNITLVDVANGADPADGLYLNKASAGGTVQVTLGTNSSEFLTVKDVSATTVSLDVGGLITGEDGSDHIAASTINLTSHQSGIGGGDSDRLDLDVSGDFGPFGQVNIDADEDAFINFTAAGSFVAGKMIADDLNVTMDTGTSFSVWPDSDLDSLSISGLSGALTVYDSADGLALGNVEASTIQVIATDDISIEGSVVSNAGLGSIGLFTPGNVSQGISGAISAGNLTIAGDLAGTSSSGSVDLSASANQLAGSVDIQADGTVNVVSSHANGLTITRLTSEDGDVSLNANNGNMVLQGIDAGAGDVTLYATGDISSAGSVDTNPEVIADEIQITSVNGSVGAGVSLELDWSTGLTISALDASGSVSVNSTGSGTDAVIQTPGLVTLSASNGGVDGSVVLTTGSDVGSITASNITSLEINDNNGLTLQAIDLSGDLTVTANTTTGSESDLVLNGSLSAASIVLNSGSESIDQTGGAVSTNSLQLNSGGSVDMQNGNSGSSVAIVASGEVNYNDTSLSGVTFTSVVSNNNDITLSSAADLSVGVVNAGTETVVLNANGSGKVVTVDGDNLVTALSGVEINAGGDVGSSTYALNLNAQSIDIEAAGDLYVDSKNSGAVELVLTAAGQDASVDAAGEIVLAGVELGTLSLTSQGGITDTGAVTVTGLANLDADNGSANITLGDSTDASFGSLNLTGNNVAVTEKGSTQLAAVDAANFNLVSSGNVSDTGSVSVAGLATIQTTSINSTIALDQLDMSGSLAIQTVGSEGDVEVANTQALNLTTSSIAGNLSATTTTGNITDSGTVTVAGDAAFETQQDNADISLGTLAVDGSIAVTTAGTTGDALIVNDTAIELAASNVSGSLNVTTSTGDITDSGSLVVGSDATFLTSAGNGNVTLDQTVEVGGALIVTTDGTGTTSVTNAVGDIELGAITTADLTVNTSGSITNSGVLDIANNVNLQTTAGNGNITLDQANDIEGNIAASTHGSGQITISNSADSVYLGAIDTSALQVTANGDIISLDTLTVDNAASFVAAGDIFLGAGGDANFGTLQLEGGYVSVEEVSDTTLLGADVDELLLYSLGDLTLTGTGIQSNGDVWLLAQNIEATTGGNVTAVGELWVDAIDDVNMTDQNVVFSGDGISVINLAGSITVSSLNSTDYLEVLSAGSIFRNSSVSENNLVAAGDVSLTSEEGVIGTLEQAIDIQSPDYEVKLFAGGEIDGVSANLTGVAKGNDIYPIDAAEPSPGFVIFNGFLAGNSAEETVMSILGWGTSEQVVSQFGYDAMESALIEMYATDNPQFELNLRQQPAATALWVLEDLEN